MSSISCFENLSNEIFYEIFDYLNGCDIYQAFENLNNRFQDLLNNKSFLIKINYSFEATFDSYHEEFLRLHQDHILSLHSSNKYISNGLIRWCMMYSSWNHLQSLVLDQISSFKLLVLLFYCKSFPRLYSLKISLNDSPKSFTDVYQMIFSLPVLKCLQLKVSENKHMIMSIPMAMDEQISSIEYLSIDCYCDLDEILRLMSYTPRLSHLSCTNLTESVEGINSNLLTPKSNLIHLNLVITDLYFEELDDFLGNISSSLKYLTVKITGKRECYFDGYRWEKLLSEKFPFLIEFHFTYVDSIDEVFHLNSNQFILFNRFTSSFWIEKKWILQILIKDQQILYLIRPFLFSKSYLDNLINNDSFSGIQIKLTNDNWFVMINQYFLNKIHCLLKTIDITHFNYQSTQISDEFFMDILDHLPNLRSIDMSNLSSFVRIYKSRPFINRLNEFFKNNKINQLFLRNISHLRHINFIIDHFPRLQYLTLNVPNLMNPETILRWTFLRIKENETFHPMIFSIIIPDADWDQLDKLKEMIDGEHLLKDYSIQRQSNRFDFQWK